VLSGLASFNLTFSAAASNLPLAQADLFVDGAFVQTITNLPPSPGNVLSVTIGGVTATYTVADGDSLASAAIGLASALMAQTNVTGVLAYVVGDRLLLQSQNVATLGSQITVQAGAAIGPAPALTTFATAAQPAFLDSTAYGYHLVQASNNPAVGDWLQITFIKTNGAQVTVAVTNSQPTRPSPPSSRPWSLKSMPIPPCKPPTARTLPTFWNGAADPTDSWSTRLLPAGRPPKSRPSSPAPPIWV
jgi:hypothetical protein